MTDQTIDVSAGGVEYTYKRTVTETTGKDISADTVTVSLGSFTAPGTWQAPDVITRPTTSSAVVQILIGGSLQPTAGSYYVWVKVSDSPEVVPRRTPDRIHIT